MREKKFQVKNIGSGRVEKFLLLEGWCYKNLWLFQPNVSSSKNGVTSLRINTTKVVSSNVEKSDFTKYFRDTWKNRNDNAGYKSCLNVFNKAMENKIKSYGFQTSHIGYFKLIRKQCARCIWLKKNNYPHKNCFNTCKGRFENLCLAASGQCI